MVLSIAFLEEFENPVDLLKIDLLNMLGAFSLYRCCIAIRDEMMQAPRVSIHHVQSITTPRCIAD